MTLLHAAFVVASTLAVWRAISQSWLGLDIPDPTVAAVLRSTIPLTVAATGVLALAAGNASRPARLLAHDAVSFVVTVLALLALSLGSLDREASGVWLVLIVIARAAPSVIAVVTGGAPASLAFWCALAVYAPLAAWLTVASLPFGDQVHYLLAADRLAHGSLDATLDTTLFHSLLGSDPSSADVATHVANAPLGPRTVQGYVLPLLLLPGWVAAGRLGAELVVACLAAWTAYQTLLLVRETAGDALARWTWPLVAFLPPLLPLATHLYPNALGGALIATGYRCAFTAPRRRPLLAGVLLGATLLLTPRDGLALLVLLAILARRERPSLRAFATGAAALAILSVVIDALAYGVPIPYAGYLFGTAQAQGVQGEPSITPYFWVGLPAMLFDRTFGVAGCAPWLFLAAAGLVPALRARRAELLPAAAVVAASLVGLSFFRYWEGGYAPPARYFVEAVPLLAPFVAYGLTATPRLVSGALIGLSALAAFAYSADPRLALNSAFEAKLPDLLDRILGIDPIGWLPSFQPLTATWYLGAYPRLIPALAAVAALAWYGRRTAPGRPQTPP